ncbi:hypothetical protein ACHMWN_15485 [Pedobacter sp. UC225_61]|uniref:hypothetical protein n=1 Tax=Pedobacter sp. UC225_61 TaxID=3374623 RepID=UPI0037887E59
MKNLLLILLLAPAIAFGQVKKKTQTKLTEIQSTKAQALKWFKNVYVENNFKDPYSYKLMKSSIYAHSYYDEAQSRISTASDDVNYYKNEIISIDSTDNKFKRYKNQ